MATATGLEASVNGMMNGAGKTCAVGNGDELIAAGVIVAPSNDRESTGDGTTDGDAVNYESLFNKLRGNTAESILMLEQELAQLMRASQQQDSFRPSLNGMQQHLELLKQRLQTDVEATEMLVRGGEKVWQVMSLNNSVHASTIAEPANTSHANLDASMSGSNNSTRNINTTGSPLFTNSVPIRKSFPARSVKAVRNMKQQQQQQQQQQQGKSLRNEEEKWMINGSTVCSAKNMLFEEGFDEGELYEPLYESTSPGSRSPPFNKSPPRAIDRKSKTSPSRGDMVRDGEARRILQDLHDELRWVDENAMRSRIDCERRLVSMLEGLESRIVYLEAEVERHSACNSAKAKVELSPALERRLVYLESIADQVESQGSVVQGLARSVEHSVQQIESHALVEGCGSVSGSRRSHSGNSHQLGLINSIVASAADSLESSLRVKMKQAVHGMDVGRKGETARLEASLRDMSGKVEFLETKIAEDHKTSVQILEMLLKNRIKRKQ